MSDSQLHIITLDRHYRPEYAARRYDLVARFEIVQHLLTLLLGLALAFLLGPYDQEIEYYEDNDHRQKEVEYPTAAGRLL